MLIDCAVIMSIALGSSMLGEGALRARLPALGGGLTRPRWRAAEAGISWALCYRTEDYKRLKRNIERTNAARAWRILWKRARGRARAGGAALTPAPPFLAPRRAAAAAAAQWRRSEARWSR